jgi:hypothetical protein
MTYISLRSAHCYGIEKGRPSPTVQLSVVPYLTLKPGRRMKHFLAYMPVDSVSWLPSARVTKVNIIDCTILLSSSLDR